uniref:Uncharacterized protein n=1 Tax=Arion vulgaris TaxID=1028688 RepID=A0A0B7AV48_9EUPU
MTTTSRMWIEAETITAVFNDSIRLDHHWLQHFQLCRCTKLVCTFFSFDPNKCQSMVVHTSVPFGLAYLEDDVDIVRNEILGHVC